MGTGPKGGEHHVELLPAQSSQRFACRADSGDRMSRLFELGSQICPEYRVALDHKDAHFSALTPDARRPSAA
jgi:hypothetical protein